MKVRVSPYLAALSTVVVVLTGVWVLDRSEQQRFRERDRADVLNQLSTVRARLEGELNQRLFLTRTLVAYISAIDPDIDQEKFESLAKVIVADQSGIPSVGLYKNTAITHIYPLAGNEKALGFDPTKVPEEREAFLKVITTRSTILAGPLELVLGGIAFIARTPVFLTPKGGPTESGPYWGVVSIAIDRDALLKEAGLFDPDAKLQYTIRGKDGLGAAGEVFFGDPTIFEQNPVILSVTLPKGSWQLAAIPVEGWLSDLPFLRWMWMGGAMVALLSGFLVFKLVRDPVRLREAVERATGALSQSEANYRELVENANSIILKIDTLGNITFFNEFAQSFFGYSEEEILGKNAIGTILPETDSLGNDLAGIYRDIIKHPERYICNENENIRRNGERIWIAWRNKPLLDEHGYFAGMLCIGNDISDRKRAEDALQKANEELESRVEERTAQIRQAVEELRSEIIERQLAQKALAKQLRLATFRANVDSALAHSDTLQNILQRCTEAMVEHLDAAFARIWTLKDKENVLELQASAGLYTHLDGYHSRVPLGQFKIGLIALNRKPHLTNSVMEDPWVSDKAWAKEKGLSAFAGTPLIVEDQVLGAIAMFARQSLSQSTIQALEFAAGEIALWLKRKQAEEALRQSEERWQLAVKGSNDGIYDCNIKTGEAFHSLRLKEMLGYSDEEMGNTFDEWKNRIHPDDLGWVIDTFQAHLNKTTPYYVAEYRIRCKDGSYKWILARGQALWDEDGNPVRIVGSHTDITERKQAEEAVRQSEAREREKATLLEETLRELQRTQAQLIQTEKMSSLGQLVAGVAHEINNPVNFIHGNLTFVNDYVKDLLAIVALYQQEYPQISTRIKDEIEEIDFNFLKEDLDKILSSMKVGTERIRQIVLTLRNFSRLDESEMKLVDIHEGIESTLLIVQNRLKDGDRPSIQVIKEYGNLPLVECYAGQLNQVFMNILGNAIDALEQAREKENSARPARERSSFLPLTGCLAPTIKIRTGVLENQRVLIEIADNGIGMSSEVKARIFDPFFTTKKVGKGTGLGMSVSYQIVVESHKGKLNCVSKAGEGTLLQIEIPIRQKMNATHNFTTTAKVKV